MKKLTFLTLSAFLMLSVIPSQIKAATDAKADKTATISTETVNSTDQLNEIKSIELTALSTSENKEILKEASPLVNEQGRHNGRYNKRHNRDVDVTIRADRQVGGDGYVGRHHHGAAYVGGGGALVLIIILILVL